MYSRETFDAINLITFDDDVSIDEVRQFATDLLHAAEGEHGAFGIIVTLEVTSFPKLGEILRELRRLHKATTAIQRLYGFDDKNQNKALATISNLGVQILGLSGKIVNVADTDALMVRLEKDCVIFPGLEASAHHFEVIQQRLHELQRDATPS